ncbi:WD40-repeat-containing domain protein [Spinellus fusiger]|nr:WD40-repeat-containing domain protein [Spinellus fusiger]
MTESSCVYGLRHQARCLTGVRASPEKSQFLVGTVGAKDNVVCLLEYDDEKGEVLPTLYHHADEVWDIASNPYDANLFFTAHSKVSQNPNQRKATLWKRHDTEDINELKSVFSMDLMGIKKVLWDPKQNKSVVSIDSSHIHLCSLEDATINVSIDAGSVLFNKDTLALHSMQAAVWNPHSPEIVAVGDQCLAGWDLRSAQPSFTKQEAHKSTIRCVDYNANNPYHVVTGGDDAKVHVWDTRHLTQPRMVVEGHTHWVWSVALNTFHDQLLLTSSSDTLVNLHNAVSVSSASYLGQITSKETDWASVPTDELLATFDQHEDSVYSVAWSPIDTWTFASLSYAGRVVISQVPTEEKFKILGV